MARFSYDGIDGVMDSLAAVAQLDDDTRFTILEAGAAVYERVQKATIMQKFRQRTGQLVNSIKSKRKGSGTDAAVVIAPTGKRRGGETNMTVAYILEYGSPRIPASHWMEEANEAAAEEALREMTEAWNLHVNRHLHNI